MGKLIQISGLPRSGTGFVSVLLALKPNCISYHELITKSDDYKKKIEDSLSKWDFVVDSSTYGYFPNHSYTNSKKVLLRRDLNSSLESSQKLFEEHIPLGEFIKYQTVIEQWCLENEVFEVNFTELFTVDSLRSIWIYCFGSETDFVEDKVKNLLDMNIQIIQPNSVIKDFVIADRISKQLNLELCQ